MYKIAVIGGGGVGKSLLTFAFAKHLRKRGLDCATVNLDPGCKHLKYAPCFDLREHYSLDKTMKQLKLGPNGALKKIYEQAHADHKLKASLATALDGCDCALLDTAGSMELFLLEDGAAFLKSIADAVLFVVDNQAVSSEDDFLVLKTISAIQTIKYCLPTLTIVNKADLLEKAKRKERQKRLALPREGGRAAVVEHLRSLFEEIGKEERLVFVSALERSGLDELMDAVNELKCECGDMR
ncbi:ATP/GTP-binding protein [Candidatus Micrarchaeota archaeon]|nr:ATP/GTP-binding protein [Candidatus Micrarchaeota archaeon]